MKKEHLSTLSHLKERMELIKEKPGLLRTKDIELVYNFAGKLASKEYLGGIVQGVVLFGSVMRNEATKESDLDVLVLLDDVSNEITSEMASAYSLTVGSLLAKLNAHNKIHLTTLGIIRFWDGVRNGDPVIMSILRSGKAIVDTGFFTPLKAMLEKGMIKPTREAIIGNLRLAESLLRNLPVYNTRSISDCYWAVMDAAHAIVMHAGLETTHPKKVASTVKKALKKLGINDDMSETVDLFVKIKKDVTHGKIKGFTGAQVDKLKKKAEAFVKKAKRVIE